MKHLKPARFQILRKPQIGDAVSFCLMGRESSSSIAVLGGRNYSTSTKDSMSRASTNLPMISTAASQTPDPTPAPTIPPFLMSSNAAVYFHRLASLDPQDPVIEEDLCSLESKRSELLSLGEDQEIVCIDDCIRFMLLEIKENDMQTSSISRPSNKSLPSDALLSPAECHLLFNFVHFDPERILQQLEQTNSGRIDQDSKTEGHRTEEKVDTSQEVFFYQLADGQLGIVDESCMACLMKDARIVKKNDERVTPSVRYSNLENESDPVCTPDLSQTSEAVPEDVPAVQLKPIGPVGPDEALQLPATVLRNVPIRWIEEETVDTEFRKR